jgi:hypothetical protein
MKVWHRRYQPVEGEVDERVAELCAIKSTAIVNAEEDNSIVEKFLKHPCRRIYRKMGHGQTAGVVLELSDLINTTTKRDQKMLALL